MAKDELPEMAHGGMACGCDHDDGLMADPMAMGTTPSEMADDIPVMLSENEYVLPATRKMARPEAHYGHANRGRDGAHGDARHGSAL